MFICVCGWGEGVGEGTSHCGTELGIERVVDYRPWANDKKPRSGDNYTNTTIWNSKFNPAFQIILKLYYSR